MADTEADAANDSVRGNLRVLSVLATWGPPTSNHEPPHALASLFLASPSRFSPFPRARARALVFARLAIRESRNPEIPLDTPLSSHLDMHKCLRNTHIYVIFRDIFISRRATSTRRDVSRL